MLSIVSTPIGNLEDITLRALRILREADYIACEDTRMTGQLLQHYEILNHGRLLSFHSHSGFSKVEKIIELLQEGKHVALVSDAGTPGISDPGYVLIKKAIEANIVVTPVPGASAVLAALVASGFDCHQYLYLGFLPVKKGRQTMLKSLQHKEYTVVIYESVHRIEKTLAEFEQYFGLETPIVVGREITKKFEEFCRGSIGEVRLIPRQVAMYLLKNKLNYTYERIGNIFSGRNHTAVMYSCKKLEEIMKKDQQIVYELNVIRDRLGI